MPRETITIELSKLAPYEAAARLLSVIAYPNSQSERRLFADAICGWVLSQSWDDRELAATPMTAPPQYWKAANGANAMFKKGMLVINRKVAIAAKQASPMYEAYYHAATTGSLPAGFKPVRPTSREMIEAVSTDLSQPKRRETRGRRKGEKNTVVELANVAGRIWKPNRPVIHLCLALDNAIHHISPNRQDIHLGGLMDTKTVAGVIVAAGTIAIAMRPCFGIGPEELIEVIAA